MKVKLAFMDSPYTTAVEREVDEFSIEFKRSLDTGNIADVGVTLDGVTYFTVYRMTVQSSCQKANKHD